MLSVLAFTVLLQQDGEILFEGTGTYRRPIVTNSEQARKFFDQGLRLVYAFNHGEAKRSFRAAIKYDPECAMAYWGLATANGPHVNVPMVPPDDEKEAAGALERAKAYMASAKLADQALIKASLVRFHWPQPKNRRSEDEAYAAAMKNAWARYPDDPDVGALFAESQMDLRPWDYWKLDGSPQPGIKDVVSALELVIGMSPEHPFGLHLYIHAMEASLHPEKAEAAADRLRNLQPSLGHNVHMPSHIDIRLGHWNKAILANEKAIRADKTYRARRPQQFVYRMYMAHNHHMLAFADMMTGRSKQAIMQIDTMLDEMPEDFRKEAAGLIDGFFSMPYEVRVRFGKWDDVLALPEPAEYFPISRALHHSARSVAFAATGDRMNAHAEKIAFVAAKRKVAKDSTFGNNTGIGILAVAEGLMNGEILAAEGKSSAAIAELRQAVRAEDALRYDEPPDWIQPTRHTLGAVLIKAKRYKEAEQVYRDDLKYHPNNGWALYGLAQSLDGMGRKADAAKTRAKFAATWAQADMKIDSSCLCLPGK